MNLNLGNLSNRACFDNVYKYHGKTWTSLHSIWVKAPDYLTYVTTDRVYRLCVDMIQDEKTVALHHDGVVWGELSVQEPLRSHGTGSGTQVVSAAQLAVVVRRREHLVVWRRSVQPQH